MIKEEFNITPQQMSKLFFGGILKEKVDVPILNELGVPLIIKSGINRGTVKTKKQEIEIKIEGLGLVPKEAWKSAKVGIYSTNEAVLNEIAKLDGDAGKIAKFILELRGLNKLVSTYYVGVDKFIDKSDSCIHHQLSHCGYVNEGHVSGGTSTGRLSCTKPNLQQVPN